MADQSSAVVSSEKRYLTVISCTGCDYSARFENRYLAQSAADMHRKLGGKHKDIRAHAEEKRETL